MTNSSAGNLNTKEGYFGLVLLMVNERCDALNLTLPVIRSGELNDRALSNPLTATLKGESSSCGVNGDGGSERFDETEIVRPSPLGRRISSMESLSDIES